MSCEWLLSLQMEDWRYGGDPFRSWADQLFDCCRCTNVLSHLRYPAILTNTLN